MGVGHGPFDGTASDVKANYEEHGIHIDAVLAATPQLTPPIASPNSQWPIEIFHWPMAMAENLGIPVNQVTPLAANQKYHIDTLFVHSMGADTALQYLQQGIFTADHIVFLAAPGSGYRFYPSSANFMKPSKVQRKFISSRTHPIR
jgi:hypothetical protein